jgi:hypothetical protein
MPPSRKSRPRVLVDVSPPILAETLATALRDRDLEVVVYLDGGTEASDVVLAGDLTVTDGRTKGRSAGHDICGRVILLDADGNATLDHGGTGEAQAAPGGTGLAQILELVDRLITHE